MRNYLHGVPVQIILLLCDCAGNQLSDSERKPPPQDPHGDLIVGNVQYAATPKRILIVDDERDILTTFKKALESKGYEVDAFIDPVMALLDFTPGRYDIVLTDVKMPGLNGFELYHRIRKQDEKAKMFFLTAIDIYEHEVKLAFPNLDPDAFIHKPIAIDDLITTIESQLPAALRQLCKRLEEGHQHGEI